MSRSVLISMSASGGCGWAWGLRRSAAGGWAGVAAARARALGSGGVAVIARATGADVKTVRRGTAEIESGAEPGGRVRGPGGGRPSVADLDAGVLQIGRAH